jgi:HEAT repeat protein
VSSEGRNGPLVGDEEARRAAVAALVGGEEALAQLVEALGDESWRVRKEAAARAASWDDRERAIAALIESLAEPATIGRRNAAVEGLVRLGEPAVSPLLEALERRPEHRKLIIDTLGLIGDPRGAPALAPLVDDPDLNVRAAAGEALGLIGGPEAEAALAKGLERGQVLLSLACLEALNRLGAALPLARIERLLPTSVLKPSALIALGNSRDPAAARALLGHLGDRSRVVRESAMVALDHLHATADGGARAVVAEAMDALPDGAAPLLVQALLEAQPASRRAAASVLGLTGQTSAVRPLLLALGDPDVQEAAALALARIGGAAIGQLAAMVPGLDGVMRAAVFRLLPALVAGGPATDGRVQALLLAGLGDEDADAAAQAALSLGEIGSQAALAALANALGRRATAQAAASA